MNRITSLGIWVTVVCVVILAGLVQADTITVGHGGGYDYATIQEGIDAANNGDTVLVAEGIYTGPGNRDIDFGNNLPAGLVRAITLSSTNPYDPCVVAATVIDCDGTELEPHRGFYFHSGEDLNSVVSGLTIKNGYVYGENGGAIYCEGSSPTIKNCVIVNNTAKGLYGGNSAYGGAVYSNSNSKLTFKNCIISRNQALATNGIKDDGWGYGTPGGSSGGGGIFCKAVSIENCTISNNAAVAGAGGSASNGGGDADNAFGGGIYLYSSDTNDVNIVNCTINNNEVTAGDGGSAWAGPGKNGGNAYGGGIYTAVLVSTAEISNCLVVGNTITGGDAGSSEDFRPGKNGGNAYGGGIYCESSSTIEIQNNTIADNVATGGNGCYGWPGGSNGFAHGAGVFCDFGTITNSIIWNNNGEDEIYSSGIDVGYSDIKGGYAGTNNIDADPCFATGPLGNYYLSQVVAGQTSDSPCVNMGSDTAANLGMDIFTTRIDKIWDEGIVDIGYHYAGNVADLDNDGNVDLFDFSILASQWQYVPGVPSADIAPDGGDGIVDIKDLAILCENYLW